MLFTHSPEFVYRTFQFTMTSAKFYRDVSVTSGFVSLVEVAKWQKAASRTCIAPAEPEDDGHNGIMVH